MDRLVKEWADVCAVYSQQLALLESGKMHTYSNKIDTTLNTIMRIRGFRTALEGLIAQYKSVESA